MLELSRKFETNLFFFLVLQKKVQRLFDTFVTFCQLLHKLNVRYSACKSIIACEDLALKFYIICSSMERESCDLKYIICGQKLHFSRAKEEEENKYNLYYKLGQQTKKI